MRGDIVDKGKGWKEKNSGRAVGWRARVVGIDGEIRGG